MHDLPVHTMATLTIIRFRTRAIPFALLAMAMFRLPLALHAPLRFWRLMGSGKNGTFDKTPDLHQWAIMGVFEPAYLPVKKYDAAVLVRLAYGSFIAWYIRFFAAASYTYLLQPIEGHGLWNGKMVFGPLPKQSSYEGTIAVMTRATIRISKLKRFWQHVPAAAAAMAKAPGFIKSYGVGEWPWIKQATFSLWKSKADMKAFAYQHMTHKDIVRKTHSENWYSEDMFVRFIIAGKF